MLFFEPLSSEEFKYPLTNDETLKLARSYGQHIQREFQNELSSFYSFDEIRLIIKILKNVHDSESTISELLKLFEGSDLDGQEVLKDLYNRSFLGMRNSKGHVFFKYKFLKGHTYGAELNLDHDHKLLTHTVFEHQFQDFY